MSFSTGFDTIMRCVRGERGGSLSVRPPSQSRAALRTDPPPPEGRLSQANHGAAALGYRYV
ncbi:UNVERIFIED_CONTAM: hypothetical protein FKN15_034420 [Acipenser sinensis]